MSGRNADDKRLVDETTTPPTVEAEGANADIPDGIPSEYIEHGVDVKDEDIDALDTSEFEAGRLRQRVEQTTDRVRKAYAGKQELDVFESDLANARTERQQNALVSKWGTKLSALAYDKVGGDVSRLADDVDIRNLIGNQATVYRMAKRVIRDRGAEIMIARDRPSKKMLPTVVYTLEEATGLWNDDPDGFGAWVNNVAMADLYDYAEKVTKDRDVQEPKKAIAAKERQLARFQTTDGHKDVREQVPVVWRGLWANRQGAEYIGMRYEPCGLMTACYQDEVDANPRYIGAQNGVVDLVTGRLLPVEEARTHKVTMRAAVEYKPDAWRGSDVWDLLTWKWDEDVKQGFLELVGFAMRGQPTGQWGFLVGPGDGGKTTLLTAIASVLGQYGLVASQDTLRPPGFSKGGLDIPTMEAMGKRVAVLDEVEVDNAWKFEATFKNKSGTSRQTARGMRHDRMTTSDLAPVYFSTSQHLVKLDWSDSGNRRRCYRMKVPGIEEAEKNPAIGRLVATEARREALFSLLVHWAGKMWDREPAKVPGTDEILANFDNDRTQGLAAWMRSRFEVSGRDADVTHAKNVWAEAQSHMRSVGEDDAAPFGLTRLQFMLRFRDRFELDPQKPIRNVKGVLDRGWRGVRMRTDAEVAKQDGGDAPAPHTPTPAPSKAEQPRQAAEPPRTAPVRAPEASTRQQRVQPLETGDMRGGIRCLGECGELYTRADMSTPTLCKNCA